MKRIRPFAMRRTTVRLSVTAAERELIDCAARSVSKSATAFVKDAAYGAAMDVILDRTRFPARPTIYQEFLARLDEPPTPNGRLRRTLATPAPWE